MPLPRTRHPTFKTKLPSSGETVTYRMMTAREEKILLIAKQGGSATDALNAVLQVVGNCVVSPEVDVRKVTVFDLEWLFVQIRIVSVGGESEVSYEDPADDRDPDGNKPLHTCKVDLTRVEVRRPDPEPERRIRVGESVVMEFRWPRAELYASGDLLAATDPAEAFEILLASCVDKVYDEEQVYDASEETLVELRDWVQDLSLEAYEKAQEFLSSVPHLHYEISYVNTKGDERKIALTSLTDFFTFA